MVHIPGWCIAWSIYPGRWCIRGGITRVGGVSGRYNPGGVYAGCAYPGGVYAGCAYPGGRWVYTTVLCSQGRYIPLFYAPRVVYTLVLSLFPGGLSPVLSLFPGGLSPVSARFGEVYALFLPVLVRLGGPVPCVPRPATRSGAWHSHPMLLEWALFSPVLSRKDTFRRLGTGVRDSVDRVQKGVKRCKTVQKGEKQSGFIGEIGGVEHGLTRSGVWHSSDRHFSCGTGITTFINFINFNRPGMGVWAPLCASYSPFGTGKTEGAPCATCPHHRGFTGGSPVSIQSFIFSHPESGRTLRNTAYQLSHLWEE